MGMQNSFQSRRVDLDCLRVFAVLWLFPYHTARIFDISKSYYIQDDHLSAALTYILIDGIGPWHMPLFFLLSGSATYFALNFRSSQQYIKERFKRLLKGVEIDDAILTLSDKFSVC
ncbi:acyltransferase family protein [Desulfospira joergensenii]|uniref:acyltransferase family protein n=1 Tax=Desulfospira joergensenii TaxID=53329 RepID=UPI0003B62FFE|nr:acyltransferase family protein [Desulfospira joergensenii]